MSMGNPGNPASASGEVSNLLVQGFKAAKEGRRDEAYNLFCDVVRRDPNNELGWLYRAATTDDLSEAYVCLQRVLSINPGNEKAQRGIERIQARLSSDEDGSGSDTQSFGNVATPPPSRVGEDTIVSGLGSAPRSPAAPPAPTPDSQSTARYPYEEAVPGFNYSQQADQLPNFPSTPPPPYRGESPAADFDQTSYQANYEPQSFNPPNFQGNFEAPNYNPPPGYPSTQQMPGAEYNFNPPPPAQEEYPAFMNQRYGDQGPELVDEPIAESGMAARTRQRLGGARRPAAGKARAGAGLAPVFGRLAGARQRGRAAFGTENNTNLDETGRERANRRARLLYILGAALAIIAIILIVFLVTRPKTADNTEVAVVTPTTDVNATPGANLTPGAELTPSANLTPGGTVIAPPIVGGTSPAGTATTPAAGTQTTAPAGSTTAAANPTTAAPPANPTTAAPPASGPPRPVVYTIKSGDNLTRIAQQFSTSVDAITSANPGINPSRIFSGQQLVVPVGRPQYRGKGVILKAGETLQTIADRYKLGLDGLVQLNSLASASDVKAGDAVLIP